MTLLPRRRRRTSSKAPEGGGPGDAPGQDAPAGKASPGFGLAAVAHYTKELHRYLSRRLRNPQDVDDLAQEVYLRLLRMDETKCVRQPLAYLYGVAAHVVADFWIENGRGQPATETEPVEEIEDDAAAALPDDLAERLNLQQQLERAIAQLPPLQAAILVLHKRDGFSYEEVAERLGISVHTVEKYLTRAKAQIRAMSWER